MLCIFFCNFNTILIQVFNLCYSNLRSISLIVGKLCAFRHRSNFSNFKHLYYITFNWKGNFKFWWFNRKSLVQIYQSQHQICAESRVIGGGVLMPNNVNMAKNIQIAKKYRKKVMQFNFQLMKFAWNIYSFTTLHISVSVGIF